MQGTPSLEMEGLCGKQRYFSNWIESLIDKDLRDILKYECGSELPSLSLYFCREGDICAQGSFEGTSTITHGDFKYTVPGPSRYNVEVVAHLGYGSSYTITINFWGQWNLK